MELAEELKRLVKERPLKKLTNLHDAHPLSMGATYALSHYPSQYWDRFNQFILSFDGVYDIKRLQQDEKAKEFEEATNDGLDAHLLFIDDVPGIYGAILQHACVYAVATTSFSAVRSSYMHGKNTAVDTSEYIAKLSDKEYFAYLQNEHPISYAILKEKNTNAFFVRKQKAIVMGYLYKWVEGDG